MPSSSKAWPGWPLRVLLGSIPVLLLLLLWVLAARGEGAVVPSIGRVLEVLSHPLAEPPNLDSLPLAQSALISLCRVAAGFGLALATAIPLGVLAGRSAIARHAITPIVEIARPISPVAWIPLAIILCGFASVATVLFGREAWRHDLLDQLQLAIIAVIWYGAFFPIFLNTVHGVANLRRLHIEIALANGASPGQVLWHVILPASLPAMMVGIRLGMGRALMVIVAAEFFPGTRAGLGYFITTSHQVAQYEYAFASIVGVGAIGLLVNLVLQRIENRVSRWQAKER